MLFLIIILFFAIILFAIHRRKPETRGKLGEDVVKLIIGETIEYEQYVINDIIISHEDKTSQIDHIVINPRGVFVIETKNYAGIIYGSEKQLEWTQVLSYGNVKNKFYNPIKQNATHVYHVKKIVGKIPVYSLVVFVQNNTYNIESNNVVSLFELKEALEKGQNILSVKEMETAYNALLSSKAEITMQEHIYKIRERQYNLENGICPRCGGKLILRSGKYGEFLGCSNYPKCSFIKK